MQEHITQKDEWGAHTSLNKRACSTDMARRDCQDICEEEVWSVGTEWEEFERYEQIQV